MNAAVSPVVLLNNPSLFATLPFPEAFDIWLESRRGRLAKNTYQRHLWRRQPLVKFFHDKRLSDFTAQDLYSYQQWRARTGFVARQNAQGEYETHQVPAETQADTINHELCIVRQLLKRAGRWHLIRDLYEPLPVPRCEVGKALTAEEEETLFRVASSKPTWKVAYLSALITAHTTIGPGELRDLRLADVDLPGRVVCVREGAKNQYRVRRVPLNETAYWAVSQLLERAKDKGCSLPDHYLLPGRIQRGPYDPSKPMDNWRTAWCRLREAAGMPWLRPYDLRHHAITRLAEKPEVSEQTIQAIAGHVSQRMLRHYSHIRLQAKREALELLASAPAPTRPASTARSEMTGEGQNRVQLGASDKRGNLAGKFQLRRCFKLVG
jgi:integrase